MGSTEDDLAHSIGPALSWSCLLDAKRSLTDDKDTLRWTRSVVVLEVQGHVWPSWKGGTKRLTWGHGVPPPHTWEALRSTVGDGAPAEGICHGRVGPWRDGNVTVTCKSADTSRPVLGVEECCPFLTSFSAEESSGAEEELLGSKESKQASSASVPLVFPRRCV
jgi:hypothetical protein